MEEMKENTLSEMMQSVVALSSLLAVLAQKDPQAIILSVDLTHRGASRVTAHPGSYDNIKRLFGLMMHEGAELTQTLEDKDQERGYELLERRTLFETWDNSLKVTLVSYERQHVETEWPHDSIMGLMSDIKKRADQIIEGGQ